MLKACRVLIQLLFQLTAHYFHQCSLYVRQLFHFSRVYIHQSSFMPQLRNTFFHHPIQWWQWTSKIIWEHILGFLAVFV